MLLLTVAQRATSIVLASRLSSAYATGQENHDMRRPCSAPPDNTRQSLYLHGGCIRRHQQMLMLCHMRHRQRQTGSQTFHAQTSVSE